MNEIRPIRAKSGTNQEGASAHNRRVMIDALRLNGHLSRADLARATALTKQAVSNIIEELENDGLVASLAAVRKGRGQPSTPYRLVPEGAFAIGLQIDRHVTRTVAVDLIGTVLARNEVILPAGGPETGVEAILTLIDETRQELSAMAPQSRDRLVGLGVAMPGPFGVDADADDPWMMAAWQSFPLLERLAVGTGLDVRLQNDAAAAATAEKMVGAAHGVDHALCVYLGYGLGAGLILNGELYRGAHGNAGEIGMILSRPRGGADDGRAPLEHRISIASLCKILEIDPADGDLYGRIDAVAHLKDRRVAAWIAEAAFELRATIQLLETVFDPQMIILCGGMPSGLARLLMDALHPLLPSIAERRQRSAPRLQLGFTDPWAVAIGAAAEPISRTFDPRFSAILKTRAAGPP
ncbi:ROK family transcriptional regulator [Sinorhizobium meliloti]|uniref:ROK family transcriptional regulator n=1 Tax=Rhizobium meliloti TaxID=382 RepID=UPI0006147605|nr:ROK family transcriptional regulator [Sinorhizobium meliloti]KKA11937.1 ROK family transcriptional regulator [Sinorhizobium meliloti]MDE3787148.1 ROK family transcriptional regulator [Sinorhizobium meliloti]QND29333.1 ROK family transcriptional regulator [Sinorhizobium meliloti]RMI07917.1 ROK family transcriptional regulator [Sinorhizobium meliloti]RMI18393.1 ROK family transcriptional regulator [Sinorhizobium meliloti]